MGLTHLCFAGSRVCAPSPEGEGILASRFTTYITRVRHKTSLLSLQGLVSLNDEGIGTLPIL